jgi:hypothetical protein
MTAKRTTGSGPAVPAVEARRPIRKKSAAPSARTLAGREKLVEEGVTPEC